jgi:nucleoside-diphosphate-sugar epimerase
MRSAVMTGVTGFIGGKLAERLVADGWAVHAIVRPSSDTSKLPQGVECHVADGVTELTEVLRSAAPDLVFHLASLYLADHRPDQVDGLIASNILFAAQLAEAMTASGARRLVNTGTAWQHFETDAYRPVNLYAATKQAAEDIFHYYHDARGLSVLTLKLFDTYGPGDTRRKLVQLLIDAALTGEPLGMSPGEQAVDLTHVDDVVGAFILAAERLLAAERPLQESFLVSGERLHVRELVPLVSEVLDRPVPVELGARPYRAREVMEPVRPGPPSALPGWVPRWTLMDGIEALAGASRP